MDSYITKLNTDQLAIVYDNIFVKKKNAICIIASAGSGKTTTIISKIIYMIKKLFCNPTHFFITTFTRNAASELKQRLKEWLTDKEISLMTIGTFHCIAYSSVKKFYLSTESSPDVDSEQIIEDSIEKYLYDYELLLDDEEYQFENDHKYIFIDEYQDINMIQDKIISKLYSRAKLLVTVGDDQQNIYTFRHTDIKYILNFTKNYDNSKYYYLTKNYRSQKNIITLANIILKYNVNKLDKELLATREDKIKKIKIIRFENQFEELKFFVNEIFKKFTSKTIELHNIAIISRNNSTLQKIECALAEKKIPTYYLETIQDNIRTRENIQNIKNRVILSTIHGTKGLEFTNVFILNLNQGVFPSCISINKSTEDALEEERRLFYVGITRAKNNLILSYTENKPSQFLQEIMLDPISQDIINIDYALTEDIVNIHQISGTRYGITNIIANLNHDDFEYIRTNIFDYKVNQPSISIIHPIIPTYFNEYLATHNLLISNISNIFGDFMETFITRSILQNKQLIIDNHDYIMMCISENSKNIKKLNDIIVRKYLDIKYKTKLCIASDYYINTIKNYFDSGHDVKGRVYNFLLDNYIKAYDIYCSNKDSSEIIFEIFMIALIKAITRGRTSLQYLLNYEAEYNNKKINRSDLNYYTLWLEQVRQASCKLVSEYSNIQAQKCFRDDKTQIKGILDLLVDDTIIEIKAYSDGVLKIEMLIQVLAYAALARNKGIIINNIIIYNPIHGKIFKWDISNWTRCQELIDYLYTKI